MEKQERRSIELVIDTVTSAFDVLRTQMYDGQQDGLADYYEGTFLDESEAMLRVETLKQEFAMSNKDPQISIVTRIEPVTLYPVRYKNINDDDEHFNFPRDM